MTESHAVRWKITNKKIAHNEGYGKWHWTEDANFTLCGRVIRMATELYFLPDTDDDISKVDCKYCLNKLKKYNKSDIL